MSIVYNAEPTPALFHADRNSIVRLLMGPYGSGKSVACCMEIVRVAFEQEPGIDGIRRTRWAVIRNTYPELKATTIKTWSDWIKPEIFGPVKWDAPITHTIRLRQDVELEVIFLALDRPQDIKKLLSLEVTGVWINEAREIPKAVLDAATGRIGRYPSKMMGGCSWSGVILDTNPPDDDHWIYRVFEEEQPDGYIIYKQPSALIKVSEGAYAPNPRAENVKNHSKGYRYWLDMIPGKTEEWIKVYVLGLYGSVMDGKPVYPEWNDNIHMAKGQLLAYKGLPLILGWDFGLTPACIIGQVTPRGQLRILDELVAEDMGIRSFANHAVKPFLATKYPGMQTISSPDPAGNKRAESDETNCHRELEQAGFKVVVPRTNLFTPRREAVAGFLTRLIDGQPGFLLSATCKTLRKGFNGGYKYRRMQVPGEERFTDEPDKNSYSHPHDALQYLCMYIEQPKQHKAVRVNRTEYRPGDSAAGY